MTRITTILATGLAVALLTLACSSDKHGDEAPKNATTKHDEHGSEKHSEHGEGDHDDHGAEKHGEKGHEKHGKKGHDEHGEEGHDEHGEEGHDEHGEEGHDEHGKKGHDEHGEDGHREEEEGHEEGVVHLAPELVKRLNIDTARVEHRAFSAFLSTTGRVGFDEDHLAHVAPRVSGRVVRVRATLGSTVKGGQSLATIDSIELGRAKNAYLRAKAERELSSKTLEREQSLRNDRISSEQSLLQARANNHRAVAAYQAARQELRLLGVRGSQIDGASYEDPSAALFHLTAPISGTVVQKHVNLGEVVSPERNLYTVADLSRLWIWIDVYERDLARVHIDDVVNIEVDAFPQRTFKGKVAYVRHQVDPDTRAVRARVDVWNTDGLLRPGMFTTVTVTEIHDTKGGHSKLTFVVPAKAVQRDGTEFVCFVPLKERAKNGEARYARRVVKTGQRNKMFVEIVDGLTEKDTVVIRGTFILKSEAAKESMGGGHSH